MVNIPWRKLVIKRGFALSLPDEYVYWKFPNPITHSSSSLRTYGFDLSEFETADIVLNTLCKMSFTFFFFFFFPPTILCDIFSRPDWQSSLTSRKFRFIEIRLSLSAAVCNISQSNNSLLNSSEIPGAISGCAVHVCANQIQKAWF